MREVREGMNSQPDADGRYALSGNEYYALRYLFGIISGFETSMGYLKERAQLKQGTWRDMKMIAAVAGKTVENLLATVPAKKLVQIHKELANTQIDIRVKGTAGIPSTEAESYCYVPENAIDTLVQNMLEYQCFACEKTERESRKCPYRKAIDGCFPFEQPEGTKDQCRYCGYSIEKDRSESNE